MNHPKKKNETPAQDNRAVKRFEWIHCKLGWFGEKNRTYHEKQSPFEIIDGRERNNWEEDETA